MFKLKRNLLLLSPTIALLPFLNLVEAQYSYQLHDADISNLVGASQACLDVYNANVSCPESIGWFYGNLFEEMTAANLTALCTTTCLSSLQSHRAQVAATCGSSVQYFDNVEGTYWVPTLLDDRAIYGYNLNCLVRSEGQYCNEWFQTARNSSTSTECDLCNIKSVAVQANSIFEADDDSLKALYVSLTSSCKQTGMPLTTQSASAFISSTAAATRTCSGTSYTIQPTDTFYSIPKAQKVSTDSLLNANNLPYNSSAFPSSGTLCIEKACNVYIVQANDTCRGISSASNATYAQLLAWNTNINGLCTNLGDMVGQTLCLSNPLGDYTVAENTLGSTPTVAAPVPTNVGPNTTATCGKYYEVATGDDCSTVSLKFGINLNDFRFLNPEIWTNCTNLWLSTSYCVQAVGDITTYPAYPYATTIALPAFTPGPKTSIPWVDPALTTRTDIVVVPLANGTREDCFSYIWINGTASTPPDCWQYAWMNNLSPEEFSLWNPSLDKNPVDAATKTYNYACTLATSVSYCFSVASPTPHVAATRHPPSPRAAGEDANCNQWQAASTNYTCLALYGNAGLTLAEFVALNPSAKADCSGLAAGTYYCIGNNPNGDNVDDDSQANPTTTGTSTQTSATSTGTGIVTPTPTQAGMISTCNKFYKVIPNDGCEAIATANSISLSDFYTYNPAIGACTSLQPDYYVCVGTSTPTSTSSTSTSTSLPTSTTTTGPSIPGPTQAGIPAACSKYVLQAPNVYCYDMAAAASITLAQLYYWNPALNGDCSGLWGGYAYCVGIAPPGPVQTGVVATCEKYVLQIDGVYCYDMAAAAGVALADLYTWNPGLNGDCSGLWAGYAYCVAAG